MNGTIEVTAKSIYGNVMLYPANDQAKLLASMVQTRTLTGSTLRIAKAMGFAIKVLGDATLAAATQEKFA